MCTYRCWHITCTVFTLRRPRSQALGPLFPSLSPATARAQGPRKVYIFLCDFGYLHISMFHTLAECCDPHRAITHSQTQSGSRKPSPGIPLGILDPGFSQSQLVIISKNREAILSAQREMHQLYRKFEMGSALRTCELDL